jgi:hypothetical protein
VTITGEAVAVAEIPARLALAVRGCQIEELIQNHVGMFTTVEAAGLVRIAGDGRVIDDAARCATVVGVTPSRTPYTWLASHTIALCPDPRPGPVQLTM